MSVSKKRILVADDDARWEAELSNKPSIEFTFTNNLSNAIAFIDRRRRWDGAIFDRYLLEGDIPFPLGKLINDAGFILAIAFLKKFPNKRICICSGDPDMDNLPDHLLTLLRSKNCRYIFKGRTNSAKLAVNFVLGQALEDSRTVKIFNYLLLQPNLFGFGLNLRAIIDEIASYVRTQKPLYYKRRKDD